MLPSATILLTLVSAASAYPTEANAWKAPGPGDSRGPCPMVNSLANHGFLPRDGLNISLAQFVTAFRESVFLADDATALVAGKALAASTTGNPNTIHLSDLNKRGVIEHDGSLSRGDAAQGDNHSFNPAIWASVAAHFTEDKISIATAAKARKDRLAAAQAANPSFAMSASDVQNSMLETALYLRVFGDGVNGNARRDWVKTLFEQERLPYEQGYQRPAAAMTAAELLGLATKVAIAA